jgi:hypothetical protein
MRASLGLPALPYVLFVVLSVGCGGNAPLPIGSTSTGAAGTHAAAGAAGHGGSTSTTSGAAGSTLTGIGGAAAGSGPAVAGASGGPAGTVGTAGTSPVGPTGQAGDTGISMCGSPTLPNGLCAVGAFKRPGFGCACQDGTPCVCGQTCVDPMTDDDNCGACGLHCGPTSTCNNGVCGPPVVEVVPPLAGCGSIDLAIDNGTLYWTDQGHATVKRMKLVGGTPQTIGDAEKPSKIVVAGTAAYWLYSNASIRRSIDGGAPAFVWSNPTAIRGLAVSADGATVFFSSETNVSSISGFGGAAVPIAQELRSGLPGALVLVGSNAIAFPVGFNGDVDLVRFLPGQVVSCGVEDQNGDLVPGTNCTRLARSQGELFTDAIITQNGLVVWADGPNVKSESAAVTMFSPFDSVAMTNDPMITGLAGKAGNAYYSDGGVVYKSFIAPNQAAVRIARGQNAARALAVGETRVYWSTANCAIESQLF